MQINHTEPTQQKMVAQRELDERLRAIDAQLHVEQRDWNDEERKLYELEETYLRDTIVHGNIFTGWGDAKTAPIRFRNAALRRKKRERQDPSLGVTLSVDEQLKVDKHRFASFSSVTSPAESILATLETREKDLVAKATATTTTVATATAAAAAAAVVVATTSKLHSTKKARK